MTERKFIAKLKAMALLTESKTLGWDFVRARDQTESWAKGKEYHTGAHRQIKVQPSQQSKTSLLQQQFERCLECFERMKSELKSTCRKREAALE